MFRRARTPPSLFCLRRFTGATPPPPHLSTAPASRVATEPKPLLSRYLRRLTGATPPPPPHLSGRLTSPAVTPKPLLSRYLRRLLTGVTPPQPHLSMALASRLAKPTGLGLRCRSLPPPYGSGGVRQFCAKAARETRLGRVGYHLDQILIHMASMFELLPKPVQILCWFVFLYKTCRFLQKELKRKREEKEKQLKEGENPKYLIE